MADFRVPNSQGQVRQNNRSDTFGELAETFSIDLNRKFGKIFPSKKLIKVLDETTDLSDSDPQAFAIFDDKYWMLTDDDPYECSVNDDPTDSSNWSEVTAVTSSVGTGSDLAVFNNLLLISNASTAIYSVNTSGTFANNWSSGKFTTSGAEFKTMHVHRGGEETLFVLNQNQVHYYNSTGGEFIVTLQEDLVAQCVNSGVNSVWVGTRSTSDSNAYVYEIVVGETINVTDDDGVVLDTKPAARNAYKVEGTSVMSIEVIDNVPYIVTEKGNVQAFNGAGFSTVASFPFANTTEVIKTTAVHPKGMKLHNDSLYINISTERRGLSQVDYTEDCPSGVWEFNRLTGQLNHRFAFAETDSKNGSKETSNSLAGPLMIVDNPFAMLLAAGEIEGNTSGMFADTGSRYGYFKTVEIESDTVQSAFERAYIKAKTLSSGEKINIKYRTTKKDQIAASGALKNTKTFNTTEDLSAITPDGEGVYHWELTDMHTGLAGQVVSIDQSDTVYSVTVDTAIGAANDTVRAEFQNWTKVSEDYDTEAGEVKSWGDFGTNPWIQFKVILDGDIEMRQLLVKSNAKNEV